jgi:hypothetical protein
MRCEAWRADAVVVTGGDDVNPDPTGAAAPRRRLPINARRVRDRLDKRMMTADALHLRASRC